MKIAVASNETLSLSSHFGRSAFFVIFEIENAAIKGKEVRKNDLTPHARGECTGGEHSGGAHSHANIIAGLQDCEAVICAGMGERMSQDLRSRGIRPVVIDGDCSAEQAVSRYLAGDLGTEKPTCCCRH